MTQQQPEWRLRTECHGPGNWHAVIYNGISVWILPGYESQLAALAAGSESIRRRTEQQEIL